MTKNKHRHFLSLLSFIILFLLSASVYSQKKDNTALTKTSISQQMQKVADWQMVHFDEVEHHKLDWTNAALYIGMVQWAQLSGDPKYLDWLIDIGKSFHYQPYFRMYHADDQAVSQLYLTLYQLKRDPHMFNPTESRLDWVITHPSKGSLKLNYNNSETLERWTWCDALFMAPPVYAQMTAITGDKKYMNFMDKEFRATYDYLYSPKDSLFYRDYRFFDQHEANGAKVFWGRGNGWVVAGLVSILKELKKNSPYRPFYEKLFKEMIVKVAALEDTKGYWHASLLDPASYPPPEASASAFFCYALAYGINTGLIDRDKYLPQTIKTWNALTGFVSEEGKLGWVQPIGQDPKNVTVEMTEVYGVGAFLLAGSEMYRLNFSY